jgi:hypothetical protein
LVELDGTTAVINGRHAGGFVVARPFEFSAIPHKGTVEFRLSEHLSTERYASASGYELKLVRKGGSTRIVLRFHGRQIYSDTVAADLNPQFSLSRYGLTFTFTRFSPSGDPVASSIYHASTTSVRRVHRQLARALKGVDTCADRVLIADYTRAHMGGILSEYRVADGSEVKVISRDAVEVVAF